MMKHLNGFLNYNEGFFDVFKKKEPYFREDLSVSKRMKENDIVQEFEKKPNSNKEPELSRSYLVYIEKSKEKDKKKDIHHDVATLEINKIDEWGRPVIELNIHEIDEPRKIIKRKYFYNQEKAIHYFLDYWETSTIEGRERNKAFRLKRF